MQECKKCGAPLEEDGIFCPSCGARADGKKECPSCGKLIKEEAIYCPNCGKRTDGKIVCDKCGTVAEGEFCPHCGNRLKKSEGQKVAKDEKETTFGKIVKILSPALLLTSILVLFICSFCIATSPKVIVNGTSVSLAEYGMESHNVFYYLGQCYSDLADAYASEIPARIILPYIGATLAVATNFIVCAVMLAIATTKYIKAMLNKQSVELMPYFAWALGGFVLAVCFIGCLNGISAEYAVSISSGTSTSMKTAINVGLNGAVTLGLILPTILAVGGYVLGAVKQGKKYVSFSSLGKSICMVALIVLSAIVLSLTSSSAIKIVGKESGTKSILELPFGALTSYISMLIGITGDVEIGALYSIAYVAFALLAVSVFLTLTFAVSSLGKEKSEIGALVCGAIGAVLSIFYVVMAVLVGKDMAVLMGLEEISTTTISIAKDVVVVVLIAVAVVAAVIGVVFGNKRGKSID